jgi:DNA-binding NtrC family response regulator
LPKKNLDVEAKKKLMLYSFPGNIRELKSIVELACVMSDTDEIEAEHMQMHAQISNLFHANDSLTLKQFVIQLIQHYLDTNDYDVLKVAKQLKVGKSTLYRMINNNQLKLYRHPETKN